MQHGILSCFIAFKQRGSAQYALGNLKLIASYIPPPSKTSNYHHIFKVVCLGACTLRAGYADIAFFGWGGRRDVRIHRHAWKRAII